ncbi:MAG: DnaJ domain-containing protein [Chloroflexota bacterium]
MTKQASDDPYEILGVAHGSTDRTIAAAYRTLAREFHPDIAGETATAQMMRINIAFDAIRSADRRRARDGGATPAAPPADPLRRRPSNDGTAGAGPPPGRPSGSVLGFGRHLGWSIGEIARVDPGYLVWLGERREGKPYLAEIDAVLRRTGNRPEAPGATEQERKKPRRRGFARA